MAKQTQLLCADIFSGPTVPAYEIEPLKSPDEVALIANSMVLQPISDITVPGMAFVPMQDTRRGGCQEA